MTMKMISSTSITSTIGVTLMLELTFLPSLRTDCHMLHAPSYEFLVRWRLDHSETAPIDCVCGSPDAPKLFGWRGSEI
jgi:hypothetical protein